MPFNLGDESFLNGTGEPTEISQSVPGLPTVPDLIPDPPPDVRKIKGAPLEGRGVFEVKDIEVRGDKIFVVHARPKKAGSTTKTELVIESKVKDEKIPVTTTGTRAPWTLSVEVGSKNNRYLCVKDIKNSGDSLFTEDDTDSILPSTLFVDVWIVFSQSKMITQNLKFVNRSIATRWLKLKRGSYGISTLEMGDDVSKRFLEAVVTRLKELREWLSAETTNQLEPVMWANMNVDQIAYTKTDAGGGTTVYLYDHNDSKADGKSSFPTDASQLRFADLDNIKVDRFEEYLKGQTYALRERRLEEGGLVLGNHDKNMAYSFLVTFYFLVTGLGIGGMERNKAEYKIGEKVERMSPEDIREILETPCAPDHRNIVVKVFEYFQTCLNREKIHEANELIGNVINYVENPSEVGGTEFADSQPDPAAGPAADSTNPEEIRRIEQFLRGNDSSGPAASPADPEDPLELGQLSPNPKRARFDGVPGSGRLFDWTAD